MPKFSFVGVSAFRPLQRSSITGAWLKKRTVFFAKYMPHAAALRVARRWSIHPGSKHYDSGLRDGLETLDEYIGQMMKVRKVSRSVAINLVWENIRQDYLKRGRDINTSGELLHWWLTDNLESP